MTTIQGWISTVKPCRLSFFPGLQVQLGKKGRVKKQAVVRVATFCLGGCRSAGRDALSGQREERGAWPGMAPSSSNLGIWGVHPWRPFRARYVGCLEAVCWGL